MKLQKKLTYMATAIIAISCSIPAANANFADQWASNMTKSYSPASYYKGSQRGYMSGGSFSMRYKQSNDHLLTISKPRLKSGCGGIDAFMGGFSFLDTDYLVSKLQRILSAAPAAAFDIALKTLAPQVAATIKDLEAIIDKLNNLSLDDCKAAKALVTTTMSMGSDAFDAEATAAQQDFMVSSGIVEQGKTFKDTWLSQAKSNGGASDEAKAAATQSVAGCPAKLKALFGEDGQVLDKIGTEAGLPSTLIASLRGLIGDASIQAPGSTGTSYQSAPIMGCNVNSFSSFVDGTAEVRATGATCTPNTDTKGNLINVANKALTNMAKAMRNKTALAAEDQEIVDMIPMTVKLAVKTAVIAKTEDTVIQDLSEIAAYGIGMNMLESLTSYTKGMINYYKEVKGKTPTSYTSSSADSCQMSLFAKPMENMEQLEITAEKWFKEAREAYGNTMAQSNTMKSYAYHYTYFTKEVRANVTQRFGRGVALRATGG